MLLNCRNKERARILEEYHIEKYREAEFLNRKDDDFQKKLHTVCTGTLNKTKSWVDKTVVHISTGIVGTVHVGVHLS